ncbi:hypothetical protein ISF_06528 [Cordyceps fumosorosea ARSEF 2679]|uniref:Aerolysin-like toxin, beta complex domain protein n=1 Tax=Cordyceps fumosorosea (strain ARSEF 2679) TaxID=1081104 RepID=A0A167RMN4_CORFA|nr:hypothetical protein ISF_06528 [Cordyceps fumosorosea ARSEF 2679]OAA58745.1 hypothetical protein ISF_06528 [Cordyceps fumosorosea ARSEF 2679]
MKISASFAIFAAAATALPTEEHPVEAASESDAAVYARDVLTKLETLSWDKSQPPSYEVGKEWQYTCAANILYSEQVQFWEKMWILDGYPEYPITKEAFYIPNVEAAAINTGRNKDMALESATSTTSTKTETKGWTIGAKAAGNFGKKDVAAGTVELSASYSDTKTTTNTETKTVTYKGVCEPGYECRIETWSFHLKLDATVVRAMYYQLWSLGLGLGDEKYLCLMDPVLRTCDQFTSRFDPNCPQSGASITMFNRFKEVQLTVPIKEGNGLQLMSRVVLVSERLSAKKAREESEQSSIGTKETIEKAIQQGTKFQFLDGPKE